MTHSHCNPITPTVAAALATGQASQALAAPGVIGSDIALLANLLLLIISATLLVRPPMRPDRPRA